MTKRAKIKTIYICTACSAEHIKWQGRCNQCGEWNTLVEAEVNEALQARKSAGNKDSSSRHPQLLHAIELTQEIRIPISDRELSRVLDGGIVPGSLTLLGGEPGIGKSTLLIQLALQLGPNPVLYVSGEESEKQVKMRADRIPIDNPALYVYSETNLEAIFRAIREIDPVLTVIDSIQTIFSEDIDLTPGSVAQIRECTSRIMRMAKDETVATIIVGHITKEGLIAGPKALEHIVDTVLEFEGDRHNNYRIVRSSKNRFGATPEMGIYEMRHDGLHEVANPSQIFLSNSSEEFPGVAVAATVQGLRPLLIETQALASSATYGTPQRSATGFDLRRLNMLLAVLEKKCGFKLGDKDVFINLAGGIKIDDPALDLSIVCAIVSSLYDLIIPRKIAFAAETGLTGEVRPVSRIDSRISEAGKLGFEKIIISSGQSPSEQNKHELEVISCSNLQEVFRKVFNWR